MSPRKLDDRRVANEGAKLQRVREALASARRITVAPPRLAANSVTDEATLAGASARPEDVPGGATGLTPRFPRGRRTA